MYTKETMDHFQNPQNMGEIKNADGVGEVGDLKCGDVMKIYIKVAKRPKCQMPNAKCQKSGKRFIDSRGQEEYIKDIKFQTLGCAAAIASSSMLTELAREKSLDQAEKITRDDINSSLGKLPAQKYHCSILSAKAIHRAIADYRYNKE